ncbi:MAG TPA: hypothetical protein VJX92_15535 [Methylomirabilota bacterium]|nr:hypothetical protein [Methylomirabilota bacterium]
MTPRQRSAIGVNVRLQPQQETTVPVATGHGLSFWAVIVIALAMVVLVGAAGHWSAGFWVALLILVLVGALVPVAAIVFGGAALLYLALTHGQQLITNISALVAPKASQGGHP